MIYETKITDARPKIKTAVCQIARPNKAFIDIRLCPGIATPLATQRHTAHYDQT